MSSSEGARPLWHLGGDVGNGFGQARTTAIIRPQRLDGAAGHGVCYTLEVTNVVTPHSVRRERSDYFGKSGSGMHTLEVVVDASTYWKLWLTGTLGGFAMRELPELRRRVADKPSGTLSAWWRKVLGADPKHWRRHLLCPLFTVFCGWLAGHMVFGWWNL